MTVHTQHLSDMISVNLQQLAVLMSDFVSHFGSHYCWFMSLSFTEQFAPADKIKFHTSVQCQLPLPWLLILMMYLIAGDDDNWPDADTQSAMMNYAPSGTIMTLLLCWRIFKFILNVS